MNSFKLTNASKWLVSRVGNKCCYTTDSHILATFVNNPDKPFWEKTYSAFACVVHDMENNHILLVRDHFGLEPLFYCTVNNIIIFGSNIPDLLNYLPEKPSTNSKIVEANLLSTYFNFNPYSEETHLDNVYRVMSGHQVNIDAKGRSSASYWTPQNCSHHISLRSDQAYLEKFTELLLEGIKLNLASCENLAAEFSGGLDSSCIVTGLHQLGIHPELYMHIAPANSDEVDDSNYAKLLIEYLGMQDKLKGITASDFNLQSTLNEMSELFAGGLMYLFPIGANNIHKALQAKKHKIVFSGFGGDECVSGHAPLSMYLRELAKNKSYAKMKHEIEMHYQIQELNLSSLRKKWIFIRNKYPLLDQFILNYKLFLENTKIKINQLEFKSQLYYPKSIAEHENCFLYGSYSHHVMMRIEESAIIARAYGFKYCYPLLYPPLVEFCNQLPIHLKRNNGENRLIVRNYLAQFLPAEIYGKHQKVGGIMPATVSKMKQEYLNGQYKELFTNLPYANLSDKLTRYFPQENQRHLINQILRAVLKSANI